MKTVNLKIINRFVQYSNITNLKALLNANNFKNYGTIINCISHSPYIVSHSSFGHIPFSRDYLHHQAGNISRNNNAVSTKEEAKTIRRQNITYRKIDNERRMMLRKYIMSIKNSKFNKNTSNKEELNNTSKVATFKSFLNSKFNFKFLNKFSKLRLNYNNNNNPLNIEEEINEAELKARNNRIPKQANHGARPCSSVNRRLRNKTMIRKGNLRTKDEQ